MKKNYLGRGNKSQGYAIGAVLSRLERKVDETKTEVSEVKKDISRLERKVDETKTEVSEVKKDFSRLELKVYENTGEVSKIKEDISRHEHKADVVVNELRKDIIGLKLSISETRVELVREIANSKTEMIRWGLSLVVAIMLAILGLYFKK